eukprot:11893624-Alexandrium_andersonii.AAC.1
MEAVFYEACRLLDVPAQNMRLLSNEAKEIDLHSPALNGRSTLTQPLLIAACAGHRAASSGVRSAAPSPPHPEPPSDRQARAEDSR